MPDAPHIKTPLPGPKAQALIERDARSCRRPTRAAIRSSSSARRAAIVEDVDGNVFLDCAAGIAVNATGHSHPDVVKAITDQARRFLHMSGTDFYYEPQVRLAEEIAAIVPIDGGVRSFFGNSGTEAIEACHQAGALRDRAAGHHRVPRRISRPHDGGAGAHGEQDGAAARLRPVHAGGVSRAVSRLLSLPARADARHLRGRVPRLHRAPALRAARVARRSRGDRRRADSGRRRLRGRARRSSCSGCAS